MELNQMVQMPRTIGDAIAQMRGQMPTNGPTLGDVLGPRLSQFGGQRGMKAAGLITDASGLPPRPAHWTPGIAGPGTGGNPPAAMAAPQPAPPAAPVDAVVTPSAPLPTPSAPVPTETLADRLAGGFDYRKAREEALAEMEPEKKVPTWAKVASILGPALMAFGGDNAGAHAAIAHMRDARDFQSRSRQTLLRDMLNQKYDDWARIADANLKAASPFTIGRNRVQYDPTSGAADVIYQGPMDWESYAEDRGLEPGSEEYFNAVEDYVLRSAGPSALERNQQLDDYRSGNDLRMESLRQSNRRELEGIRQGNRKTLKQTVPGRSQARSSRAAPSATGPNGEKIIWDGKRWVPAS